MKAIISVYKSDAMNYIHENDLKREDVVIMCSNAEIVAEHHKEKYDEVVLLGAPMGVPSNVPYLESILLKKVAPPPPKTAASKKKEPKVEVPKVKKPLPPPANTDAEVAASPEPSSEELKAAPAPSPKAKPDAKG